MMKSPNELPDTKNEVPEPEPEIIIGDQKGFLDLPDDCLIHICRYVSLEDLSSVALTCTRLNNIARQTFALKPENKRVDVKQLLQDFAPNPLETIERFFKSFGDLFCELILDLSDAIVNPSEEFASMNESIFHLATKYCAEGALELFEAYGIALKSPDSSGMIRLFSRLKVIRLNRCTMAEDALCASQECQKLTLCTQTFNEVSNVCLPKLDSFNIIKCYTHIPTNHNANCEKLLARHTHLKAIDIEINAETPFDMDVIDKLSDLETIKLFRHDGPLTLGSWRNLQHLETLEIFSNSTDATKFLLESGAAASLKCLDLYKLLINNEVFVGLSRFKNLRVLKLSYCHQLANEPMLNLNLNELTEFILIWRSNLTVDGVVDMVEKFQKLVAIELFLTDHEINSDVYDKLVKICEKQNKKLSVTLTSMEVPAHSNGINHSPDFVQVFFNSFMY